MSWLLLPAASAADLSLSTNTLAFQVNGSALLPPPPLVAPPPQYAYLSATGNALNYSTTVTTASNVRWLKVSPASGTAPLTPSSVLLKIEVDLSVFSGQSALESYVAANCPATPTSFGPTCRGTVTVSAPGTAPRDIAITFSYLTPVFCYALTPTELNFTFQSGGATPASQNLNIFVPAGCQPPQGVAATALVQTPAGGNWLTAAVNGTAISVSVAPTGLPPGDYIGRVSVRVGPGTVESAVVLKVTPPPATNLIVPTTPINFTSPAGGPPPASQLITVTSANGSPLAFTTAVSGSQAITVSPASGTTPAVLTVTANPTGLTPGVRYTSNITITAPSAANGPQVIPVNYTVEVPQTGCSGNIDPNPVVFTYTQGGALPPTQQLRLFTPSACPQSSPATVLVQTPAGGNWLSVSNTNGISVSASPGNLPPGEYLGGVFVNVGNGIAQAAVRLIVTAPALTVPANPIDITTGGAATAVTSRSIPIGSTGGPLPFTAAITNLPGVTLTPTAGSTPATLTITSNTAGVTPGTYTGTLTITSPGASNSPQSIPISLNVQQPAALNVSQSTLAFTTQSGGPAPAAQQLQIGTAGPIANFAVPVAQLPAWLAVSPTTGTTPATIQVSVNAAGLVAGSYTASFPITPTNPATAPQTITVNLTVTPPPTLSATPSTLAFTAVSGAPTTAPQSISATGGAPGTAITATATSTGNWLQVAPATAASPAVFSVTVNPANLSAGTYSGSVTLSGAGLANSPLSIPVTVTITAPSLTVPTNPITFSLAGGSSAIDSRSIPIGSTGGPLPFTAAITSIPGVTLSANAGTTPATLIITSNAFGVTAGNYTGTLTISAPGAANSPQSIPISLTIQQPAAINVSQSTLTFTAQTGSPTPASQQLQIGASGPPAAFTVPASQLPAWLSVSPIAGTTPATLQVTVNPTGLAPGAYTASFSITPANPATAPQTITVNLTVTAAPTLTATPTSLNFAAQSGAASPAAQSLSVTGGSPNTPVTATASSTGGWLLVTPANATSPASFSVSVNPANLAAGTYSGAITLSAPGLTNSPLAVAVTLTVTDRPVLSATPAALSFAPGSLTQTMRLSSSAGPLAFSVTTSAPWISISGGTGTTPSAITITANDAGLRPGITTGTLLITAAGAANSPLSVPISLSTGTPVIATGGIVNAASSPSAIIAPGSLFSIFGANLANGIVLAETTPLPVSLGGTSVTVNGRPAPLVFVSTAQINAQMPYEIAPGNATVTVTANGLPSAPAAIEVQRTGPGIFLLQGTNHAVAQNQDFTINGPAAPAPTGSVITAYLTGTGALDNPVPTGAIAPASPLSRPLGAVSVTIGGSPATFYFAGLTPGLIGLMQLNVQIPAVPAGPQPMVVSIGDVRSNTATVTVGQ